MYSQLGFKYDDVKVDDPLSNVHDLMIKTGLLTDDIIKQNKISAEDQNSGAIRTFIPAQWSWLSGLMFFSLNLRHVQGTALFCEVLGH